MNTAACGSKDPGDGSDFFVWKDVGDDGSDSDMPEDVWKELCGLAGEDFCGVLWVDFLETN